MKKSLAIVLILTLTLALGAMGCTQQGAAPPEEDTFPDRPITIMIGFNPGGGMDIMSRALAIPMAEYLGVDVACVNMEGAGSAIAADYVNKQPADGYTLFAISSATSTFPATGYTDITYKDFQMLNIPLGAAPTFQVPMDSPIEDMADLIEAWKQGGTTASNSGLGGIWHIPQALAVDAVGGDVSYVPYDGGKPAALAVAQKDVDWGVSDAAEAREFFNENLSRPLAVFSDQPFNLSGYGEIPAITDWLPELADVIVAGSGWRAIGLKRGVPEHRLEKLYEAVEYAVQSDSFIQFANDNDLSIINIPRAEAEAAWEVTTKIQSWLMYDLGLADRSPEEVGIPRP